MLRVIPIFALVACVVESPQPVAAPSDSALRFTCASGPVTDEFPVRVWRGTLDWEWTTGGGALHLVYDGRNPEQDFLEPAFLDAALDGPPSVYTDRIEGSGTGVSLDLDRDAGLGSAGLRTGTLTVDAVEVPLVCWTEDFVSPVQVDPLTGLCRGEAGEVGRISLPLPYVRETGFGQCVDFGTASLEEGDLTYPVWSGFDLRGADLSRASLFFAHIEEARFEGALLDGLEFGYATLTGSVDERTVVPSEGCSVEAGQLDCLR
ncbi:MAG: pentapeptide repeat-containing protein [Myxococcota bacterium]